mmetsp:Transcript_40018/g.64920  ORF Transcript_40018/g.64920 Transcript_40018/m.64920 type:complete len:468 (-) Transcript_40018:558-1961(-)
MASVLCAGAFNASSPFYGTLSVLQPLCAALTSGTEIECSAIQDPMVLIALDTEAPSATLTKSVHLMSKLCSGFSAGHVDCHIAFDNAVLSFLSVNSPNKLQDIVTNIQPLCNVFTAYGEPELAIATVCVFGILQIIAYAIFFGNVCSSRKTSFASCYFELANFAGARVIAYSLRASFSASLHNGVYNKDQYYAYIALVNAAFLLIVSAVSTVIAWWGTACGSYTDYISKENAHRLHLLHKWLHPALLPLAILGILGGGLISVDVEIAKELRRVAQYAFAAILLFLSVLVMPLSFRLMLNSNSVNSNSASDSAPSPQRVVQTLSAMVFFSLLLLDLRMLYSIIVFEMSVVNVIYSYSLGIAPEVLCTVMLLAVHNVVLSVKSGPNSIAKVAVTGHGTSRAANVEDPPVKTEYIQAMGDYQQHTLDHVLVNPRNDSSQSISPDGSCVLLCSVESDNELERHTPHLVDRR